MRSVYYVFVFILLACSANLGSEVFSSVQSGNWDDYETWWGDGTPRPLPGPTDDVIISAFTDVMGGVLQIYRVNFGGNPLHTITQDNPACQIAATIYGSAGESIRLASDIILAVGSYIHLEGGILYLATHVLSDATIGGGTVIDGILDRTSISAVHLSDVELHTWTVVLDSASESDGLVTNLGTFQGDAWVDAYFTCLGGFVNQGDVVPGYGGIFTMRCHGDVRNTGTWQVPTQLLGAASRTLWLSTPGYQISVGENSHPLLQGSNLLSTFFVLSGSILTVDNGAELAMSDTGEFYIANIAGQGAFSNLGSFSATLYVNGLETIHHYQLNIEPGYDFLSAYSAIECIHLHDEYPDGLPAALGEMWQLNPVGSEEVYNAALTFQHSGSLLPRGFEMNLRLYYRLDESHPWEIYSGDYVINLSQHTFKATDIPALGQYAFAPITLDVPQNVMLNLEPSPLEPLPKLSWSSVTGALDYEVLVSDNPDGPWTGGTYTGDTFWMDYAPAPKRFF